MKLPGISNNDKTNRWIKKNVKLTTDSNRLYSSSRLTASTALSNKITSVVQTFTTCSTCSSYLCVVCCLSSCAAVNELCFRTVHVTPLVILGQQGLKLPEHSSDFITNWQSAKKLTNLHTASPTSTFQLSQIWSNWDVEVISTMQFLSHYRNIKQSHPVQTNTKFPACSDNHKADNWTE